MLKRTITGAGITAAVYLTLWFSYIPAVIFLAAALLCAFAVYEIFNAAGMIENEVCFILSMLSALGIVLGKIPHFPVVLAVAFLLCLPAFTDLMIRQEKSRLSHPVKVVAIVLLISLLIKSIPELRKTENGLFYLTLCATLCFTTDIAAYLVGKRLGRHKLLASVSPNKTIEGAVGGTVCSVLVILSAGLLVSHTLLGRIDYLPLMLYALLASLVGQFGDLAMSAVKRICGLKDFGSMFPGHGGILDRFDSHIFSAAFTFLFCAATGGFLA